MAYNKKEPDHIDVVIMTELKRYPPSTIKRIAEVANRSTHVIYYRMSWLTEKGFIQQAPNTKAHSARSRVLTQKGFEYLESPTAFTAAK